MTNARPDCPIKHRCTTGKERRVTRWEHEHIREAVQRRLDERPEKMRQRRETVEHPFSTIKARMGATHFLTKMLPRVATEMALHVMGYNLTRVINIIGVQPLVACGALNDDEWRETTRGTEIRIRGKWCPVKKEHFIFKGRSPDWQHAHACVENQDSYQPADDCDRLLCSTGQPRF